jgi:hypothetical protein
VTAEMPDSCPMCGHRSTEHGTEGCVRDWMGSPNEPCHCPADADGKPSANCCRTDCDGQIGTHVDYWGQYFCATHAPEERCVPYADVPHWQNPPDVGVGRPAADGRAS